MADGSVLMNDTPTKWKSGGMTLLRMAIVIGVVVAMPAWALFEAREPAGSQQPVRRSAARNWSKQLPRLSLQDGPPAADPSNLPGHAAGNHVVSDRSGRGSSVPVSPPPASNSAAVSQRQVQRQLARMADRLRTMGATWMRLEKIQTNSTQVQFQFVCRMPLANNPVYCRRFQAISASPVGAIQQVMEDIQHWTHAETSARITARAATP